MSLQDNELIITRISDVLNSFLDRSQTLNTEIRRINQLSIENILSDKTNFKNTLKSLTGEIIQLKNEYFGNDGLNFRIINDLHQITLEIHNRLKILETQDCDTIPDTCLDLEKNSILKKIVDTIFRKLVEVQTNINTLNKIYYKTLPKKDINDVIQVIDASEKKLQKNNEDLQSIEVTNRPQLNKLTRENPSAQIDGIINRIKQKCGSKERPQSSKLLDILDNLAENNFLSTPEMQKLLVTLCKSTRMSSGKSKNIWNAIIGKEKDGDMTLLMKAINNRKIDIIHQLITYPALKPFIITNQKTALTLACEIHPINYNLIKELWTLDPKAPLNIQEEWYSKAFLQLYKTEHLYTNSEYSYPFIETVYWIFEHPMILNFKFLLRFNQVDSLLINYILEWIRDQSKLKDTSGFIELFLFKNYDLFYNAGNYMSTIDIIKTYNISDQFHILRSAAIGAFNDNNLEIFIRIIDEINLLVVGKPPSKEINNIKLALKELMSNCILPIGGAGAGAGVIFSGIVNRYQSGESIAQYGRFNNSKYKFFKSNMRVNIITENDTNYEFTIGDNWIYVSNKSQCSIKLITHDIDESILDLILSKKLDTNLISQTEINKFLLDNKTIDEVELKAYLKLYAIKITEQGGGYYSKYQKYHNKLHL